MLAGFDTTATILTNTCFQLARNPDIQEKLHETILRKLDDHVCDIFQDSLWFNFSYRKICSLYRETFVTKWFKICRNSNRLSKKFCVFIHQFCGSLRLKFDGIEILK